MSGRRRSTLYTKESGIREGHIMFFYLLVQIFLLVLLLKKSPFALLPDVPPDGRGLNPLLKDFWMVIHPPVVFVGYAALAVPFAYALAALTANKYEDWVRLTLPWAGFSCLSLGAGIFIGAYWAYKVLGWGGYWGWDPVENASLVPWILSVAMIHGLILERTKRIFRRTNLLLAILCFLLVVYATFLVRSGVLGDFSVHSFADLGITGYLLIFMVFFLFLLWALFGQTVRYPPDQDQREDSDHGIRPVHRHHTLRSLSFVDSVRHVIPSYQQDLRPCLQCEHLLLCSNSTSPGYLGLFGVRCSAVSALERIRSR